MRDLLLRSHQVNIGAKVGTNAERKRKRAISEKMV